MITEDHLEVIDIDKRKILKLISGEVGYELVQAGSSGACLW
jgi:hypothetical protein